MEADLRDVFDTLSVLLSTLGFPLFEAVSKAADTADSFYLRAEDTEATGELVEDGFVVRSGSSGRVKVAPSAKDTVTSLRQTLMESGIIAEENNRIRFTQDHLFRTPSGAATTLLGRNANGWVEWKDAQGRTLHESRRATEVE